MKQEKRLLGSQVELLDIKGRDIIKLTKQLNALQKDGFERLYNMKIELGIPPLAAQYWQMDSMGEKFVGPDVPEPEKDKKEEEGPAEDKKKGEPGEDEKKGDIKKTLPGRDSGKKNYKEIEKSITEKIKKGNLKVPDSAIKE